MPEPENPPPQNSEAEEQKEVNTCEVCTTDNLLKAVGIKRCLKCNDLYCFHFCSTIDPDNYCVDCLNDLTLLKNEEVYKREDWDLESDRVKRIIRRARTFKIGGTDFLFAQRMNSQISDAELELKIEYFKEQVSHMIMEREERKIKKYTAEKAASIKIGTASLTTSVKTPTAVTAKTQMDKNMAKLNAVFSSLDPASAAKLISNLLKGKKA